MSSEESVSKGEVFMTRLRVHELAKELNMDNKDLIDRIEKLGIPGQESHEHAVPTALCSR